MISKITLVGNAISLAGFRPDRRELVRVVRFVFVGCASTALDFVTYQLLAGAGSPHLAKGLSYVAGMLFGFIGNKFWAFGSRRQSLAEPAIYVALYAGTLSVNVAVNAGVLAVLPDGRPIAFLAATGVTTILNYLGLRLLTFRPAAHDPQADAGHRTRRAR